MKLLMVSGDRSILQGKKGAFWYTLEEMAKHWERVDVVCPRPDGVESGPAFAPAPSVRLGTGSATVGKKWKVESSPFANVFFHPSSRGLWYQPWWIFRRGRELIGAHHHDVMTVHEYPPFYNGLGARWLHKAMKIPYMTEIHHIVGYPKAANLTEWIGYWMSKVWLPRWGTRRVAKIRVVNIEIAAFLRGWGIPGEKIEFIPSLYLDFDALKPDPSIQKTYDVVFCGRLVANKGLQEVLQAVSRLPDVRLLVIGDGPEKNRAEQMAHSLGIASRVTFTGWLQSNTDVYRAIQSAKVFVMNSRSEGGPRVLFEAMALGMPVITTKVGLAEWVIKDQINGIFTDGTAEDLCKKLSDGLNGDGLLSEIGEKAMLTIPQFDRVTQVKNYADALQRIAHHS